MKCKCGHNESVHVAVHTCQVQIHYPNEDYPCVCGRFAESDDPLVCSECEHPKAMHKLEFRCRPKGDFCTCPGFEPESA